MGKLTWAFILINVAIFEIVFSMPPEQLDLFFQALSFSGATSSEVWRWFTSLFLHVSASHLFFNMLGLYFFGKILEEEVSKQWWLAVYFVSGLLGNFVFMFTSSASVVGASGAVFGLMGAAMLLNPIKKIHFYIFPLPLGIVAILFLFFETLVVYFQPQEFATVANSSHLAGLITGSIFAIWQNPKRAAKGSLVLGVCIALLLVLGPIFALITGIGALILRVIEAIIGFILYSIAGLISWVWV